uniref:Transmembrane protein 272-like protein n=1 Tax=Halisarca dujardinii TaxID=2583056 RepID=A0AA96MN39_HALDU|nr:transmembrane protein 272-like protein [Halisarca dujardinii]
MGIAGAFKKEGKVGIFIVFRDAGCRRTLKSNCHMARAVHINNCRLNPMIPRWMIVFASAILIGITLDVLSYVWDAIYNYKRKVEERRYLNIFNILGWLVQLFYFAWVIVGTVWVLAYYGAWTHGGGQSCTTNPANPLCCEASVYLFSFVVIIFEWIALLLAVVVYVIAIILGICCISCISALGASAYKNLSGGD